MNEPKTVTITFEAHACAVVLLGSLRDTQMGTIVLAGLLSDVARQPISGGILRFDTSSVQEWLLGRHTVLTHYEETEHGSN